MTDAAPGALPRRAWQRTLHAVRSPWWRGTRERRALLIAEILLIGVVGCWLGLLAGGNLDANVGPLNTRLSVQPSVDGGSEVSIPPLGELRVHTHAGPWRLSVEVTRIDATDARRIFNDPAAVNGLGEKVVADLRSRCDHGGAAVRRWRRWSGRCSSACWCSGGAGGSCCCPVR